MKLQPGPIQPVGRPSNFSDLKQQGVSVRTWPNPSPCWGLSINGGSQHRCVFSWEKPFKIDDLGVPPFQRTSMLVSENGVLHSAFPHFWTCEKGNVVIWDLRGLLRELSSWDAMNNTLW